MAEVPEKITQEDFFRLNKTFSIWLIKKKQINFHELETKKAEKYYKKFIKKWNKKKLNPLYYDQTKLILKYEHLIKTKN